MVPATNENEAHTLLPEPAPRTVVIVSGDQDLATADSLATALRRAGEQDPGAVLEVDLAGVTFMSVSALRVLLEAERALAGRFVLGPVSPIVRRLLELTGIRLAGGPTSEVDAPRAARADDVEPAVAAPGLVAEAAVRLQQCTGIVIGRQGCDAVEARALLEQVCREHRVSVGAVADVMVAGATVARAVVTDVELSNAAVADAMVVGADALAAAYDVSAAVRDVCTAGWRPRPAVMSAGR